MRRPSALLQRLGGAAARRASVDRRVERAHHSTPMMSGRLGWPTSYTVTSVSGERSRTWRRDTSPSPAGASAPTRTVISSAPTPSSRSISAKRDRQHAVADLDHLAVDQPEHVAGLADARRGQRSCSATVTSAKRVAAAASAIATTSSSKRRLGSCTATAASPCTGERVGTTATRTPSRAQLGGGRLGDAGDRGGVGQQHDLARAGRDHRVDDLGRRSTAPVDDLDALGLEQPASPSPGATAMTALGFAAPCGDVVDQRTTTRDAVRAAGGDARLDRGAGVVDVGVDVPRAVAGADHDDRVAERGERGAQRRPQPSRRRPVEQVLHLVREPPPRVALGRRDRARGSRTGAIGTRRRRRAAHQRVEDEHEPCPPASTTPARASSGSCSGVRRRPPRRRRARAGRPRPAVARAREPRRPAAAATREDRALDRVGDGGPRLGRRRGAGPARSVARVAASRVAGRVGEAAQQLATDHAGVAARAEHRAAGQGREAPATGRRRVTPLNALAAPARMVVARFVPVSQSATGKTLSRSISARCVLERGARGRGPGAHRPPRRAPANASSTCTPCSRPRDHTSRRTDPGRTLCGAARRFGGPRHRLDCSGCPDVGRTCAGLIHQSARPRRPPWPASAMSAARGPASACPSRTPTAAPTVGGTRTCRRCARSSRPAPAAGSPCARPA